MLLRPCKVKEVSKLQKLKNHKNLNKKMIGSYVLDAVESSTRKQLKSTFQVVFKETIWSLIKNDPWKQSSLSVFSFIITNIPSVLLLNNLIGLYINIEKWAIWRELSEECSRKVKIQKTTSYKSADPNAQPSNKNYNDARLPSKTWLTQIPNFPACILLEIGLLVLMLAYFLFELGAT